MAANAPSGQGQPLPVDYRQHQVGVRFPAGAPSTYVPGDQLAFDVSSLAMTGADDQQDTDVELLDGDTVLGTFPVTNALSVEPNDEAGAASVSVEVPAGVEDGTTELTLRGVTTGTAVTIPVATENGLADTTTEATDAAMDYGTPGQVQVTVTSSWPATGTVELLDGDVVVSSGTLAGDGTATLAVPGTAFPVGTHELTVRYLGDAAHEPSQTGATLEVSPARSTTSATAAHDQVKVKKGTTDIDVRVQAEGVQPTGRVVVLDDAKELDRAALNAGRATVSVGPFGQVGTKTLTIRYLGDERVAQSTTTVRIEVVKGNPKGQ
jgi:5'-nucleotidase